ncbi:hypothetical protein D7B24_007097 [Verticillium nonalfalfae]|uniref:Uncharacterized protein n=1 Tax=Verticillium nonalfalfae TaxID=1051616 RepID=A0A3M9YC11_9PEZI|nr:uncharacterized protein D7B24_007097 [Verticillium nonalfalfae]RNJ56610.1 hypothetical protein D7B24_007097 [Verticillium nonalfalfae]
MPFPSCPPDPPPPVEAEGHPLRPKIPAGPVAARRTVTYPRDVMGSHLYIITMAGYTFEFAPTAAPFGRSGYNKGDDDDEGQNKGRSGYNKGDDEDDEGQNKGRSGYNKSGDDEDDK